MRLVDAHNHLQDDRFGGRQAELVREAASAGVIAMVVNGTSPADWEAVARLSASFPSLRPAFGLHPWFIQDRPTDWFELLRARLVRFPGASVGEIGLDRWKPDLPYEEQEEIFLAQWQLAHELNRAASLHGLKAWGRLLELVRTHPGPARGFLLHSYGGPREMIAAFADRGAYFSFPGYYLHPRKAKQAEVFRAVPPDRLLIETDAPDQRLPDELITHPLYDSVGQPINHPAHLVALHAALAALLGLDSGSLATRLTANFHALFG